MYYTYMLRCADNSIYTGMTNDLEKRLEEHISKSKNGAKYTKSHDVVKMETAWKSKEKSLACKLEYQIKQLSKQQKERLIEGEKLSTFLKGKVDCRRYTKIKRPNENLFFTVLFWRLLKVLRNLPSNHKWIELKAYHHIQQLNRYQNKNFL